MNLKKRQARARRRAKMLRLARWNRVPYKQSKSALVEDLK